uniref:SCA7 domain-containing protein n=1 Tax=Macrostomum lignano TaxID=282301 RepID=A0A1I8F5Q1_9PLAT
RYCFSHFVPEVHGCGQAARKRQPGESLSGSATSGPVAPPNPTGRLCDAAQLHRRVVARGSERHGAVQGGARLGRTWLQSTADGAAPIYSRSRLSQAAVEQQEGGGSAGSQNDGRLPMLSWLWSKPNSKPSCRLPRDNDANSGPTATLDDLDDIHERVVCPALTTKKATLARLHR